MSEERRGLFHFLCEACLNRPPVLVGGEFRWRCDHQKVTIVESGDRRSLQYDEERSRSDRRPPVIDNKSGPLFARW